MPLEQVGGAPADVAVLAMTEDGEMLVSVVVSKKKVDAAVRLPEVLARLARRFPDGYKLETIPDPSADLRVRRAVKLHKDLGAEGDRRL